MRRKKLAKRVEALTKRTGVNFDQYRDDEWASALAELIRFPIYAFKTLIQPPVLLILGVIGVTIWAYSTGHGAFGSMFLLTGLILAIPNGILLAIIYFIYTLTGDLSHLLTLSTGKVRTILRQLANRKQLKTGASSLLQGVVFSLLLPDLNRVIKKSIPIIGGMVALIVGSVLNALTKRLQKKISDIPEGTGPVSRQYEALDRVDSGAEDLARSTARIVSMPFWFIWLFVAAGTALIIYLEYQALY